MWDALCDSVWLTRIKQSLASIRPGHICLGHTATHPSRSPDREVTMGCAAIYKEQGFFPP